jgi:intracellular multiplication protein IcmL
MAEELQVVRLRNDFYRDGFAKIMLGLTMILTAIILLVAVSVYIYVAKPQPILFATDNDWRILPPVPVDQPYLKRPDLLQWVSDALSDAFTYDFINYRTQQPDYEHYFTPNGWKRFSDLISIYAPYTSVINTKLFVTAAPAGAPFVLNEGALEGRFGWWVQLPMEIRYTNYERSYIQPLVVQVLVLRVPTLNNLYGVGIDNIIVVTSKTKPAGGAIGPTNG